jgi:hypothetical protein
MDLLITDTLEKGPAMTLPRPSHATVVAYLALFVALGGTTYAAVNLPANSVGTKQLRDGAVTGSKLHLHAVGANDVVNHSLTGSQIAGGSLTGAQINASTLGTVPNANELDGLPAVAFEPHCPAGLKQTEDVCYDFNPRAVANFPSALTSCAQAGLRLPDPGEMALIFNDQGPGQPDEWVADYYQPGANQPIVAGLLGEIGASRQLDLNADFAKTTTFPYRCVTSATG